MKYRSWIRPSHFSLAFAAILVFLMSACAPAVEPRAKLGMSDSSLDGRYIAVFEHGKTIYNWNLVLLDTHGAGATTLFDSSSSTLTTHGFSPDGKRVLVQTDGEWLEVDTMMQKTPQKWGPIGRADYLPDGNLLATTPITKGILSLRVMDANQPGNPPLLEEDNAQYIFTTQLPDFTRALWWLASQGISLTLPCPTSRATNLAAWLATRADGSASLLSAAPGRVASLQPLPSLSSFELDILQRQPKAVADVLITASQTSITTTEQRNAVDQAVANLIGPYLAGVLSPDLQQPKLLFLSLDNQAGAPVFTLYLLDLLGKAQPQVLSANTRWIPSFSFSPDGRQILFEAEQNGKRMLYLANSDGTNIQVVTTGSLGQACWH